MPTVGQAVVQHLPTARHKRSYLSRLPHFEGGLLRRDAQNGQGVLPNACDDVWPIKHEAQDPIIHREAPLLSESLGDAGALLASPGAVESVPRVGRGASS